MKKSMAAGIVLFGLVSVAGVAALGDETRRESFSLGVGLTQVVQGVTGKGRDVLDAALSVDVFVEGNLGKGVEGVVHFEGGSGDGLDGEGVSFAPTNADAVGEQDVCIAEAYLFASVSNDLKITCGKIDPCGYIDQNDYAGDETCQFLSGAFKNSLALPLPGYTFGSVVSLEKEKYGVAVGLMDGDEDFSAMLDDPFSFVQVEYKGNPVDCRLYAWLDGEERPLWKDPSRTSEGWGMGLSLQYDVSSRVKAFSRVGWSDPDVCECVFFWSGGVLLSGAMWNKDGHAAGIGVAGTVFSDGYKDVNGIRNETLAEMFYRLPVSDHVTLSPDLQLVHHPADRAGATMVGVYGLRVQMDF